MKISKILVLLLVAALVMTFSPQKCLAALYDPVAPGDYSSSLSALDSELVVADGWIPHDVGGTTDPEDTTISWVITDNGNGTFTYSYTFTVPDKNPSHIIIGVSPNFDYWTIAPEDDIFDEVTLATYSPDDPGNDNPGLPDDITGLKFDITELEQGLVNVVTFTTNRMPMWGNFYSKDGEGEIPPGYPGAPTKETATAWNTGFDGSGSDYIAVPDTIIPVPGAVILGILGLGVAGLKLRKYA